MRPLSMNMHVGEQILDFLDLVRGDHNGARLVHVVVDQRIVKSAARENVEPQRGFVEHQQLGVDGHGQRQMHLGLHALGQLAHAPACR